MVSYMQFYRFFYSNNDNAYVVLELVACQDIDILIQLYYCFIVQRTCTLAMATKYSYNTLYYVVQRVCW